MGDEEKPFRFLTDEEFRALPVKEKSVYLVRAQQELAARQERLRAQVRDLVREQEKPR